MPSKSGKQHRFMEMIAHNVSAAKRAGVPQSVGRDFVAADTGKKFATANKRAASKPSKPALINREKP